MRKIRDILRLRLSAGLSIRAISASTKVSVGAIQKLLSQAQSLELDWPLPTDLDDSQLARLFYPDADTRVSSRYQMPDWSAIHQQLKRKGMTKQLLWEEYTQCYPNRCYSYSQFCRQGYSVRYFRLSRLFLELTQAKADGTYHKRLQQLAKIRLLIIDDWGLEPLTPAQRNDLMEIMDDRHGQSSCMMISQLPTDQWYASIADNTLADAILDRLMHNAHRLTLKGESMRKRLG